MRTSFKTMMLATSALSWLLVSLMPVINAHGSNAGVWETLCTVNGFKLVKLDTADTLQGTGKHDGKPCPFAHFSTFHHLTLNTSQTYAQTRFVGRLAYSLMARRVKFESPIPRAPPVSIPSIVQAFQGSFHFLPHCFPIFPLHFPTSSGTSLIGHRALLQSDG